MRLGDMQSRVPICRVAFLAVQYFQHTRQASTPLGQAQIRRVFPFLEGDE